MIRILSFSILMLLLFSCKNESKSTASVEETAANTTYYFIRHADKVRGNNVGSDPALTKKGKARAKFWAEKFKDVKFDAVYSTDYKRTRRTALPIAKQNEVPIQIYNARDLFNTAFKNNTSGKTVLVVGHSNTTPDFVNSILGKNAFEEINDSVFGNLYIVKIANDEATAELKEFNDWSFD